jgi:EpsI family protein
VLGRTLILIFCFAAGAAVLTRAERPEPVPVRTSFDTFPMRLGEWTGAQEAPLTPDILAVLGVDDYLLRSYSKPDRSGVGLYIGYYGSQRQGDTMHSPLNCLPGAGWEPVSKGELTVSVPGALPDAPDPDIVVNRYVIQKGLDRLLVLYWYQSHGRVVASEYWGKFYLVRDAVRLNRTDGALVRVIAPAAGDEGEGRAEATTVQFVKTLYPALNGYLPE